MSLDTATLLTQIPKQLFINGAWVDSADESTFDVINPATEETLASVASATSADAVCALDAACAAQSEWAKTSPRSRADLLMRVFNSVQDHRDELALLMTLEMGKPLAEANGEVTYGAEYLRWFAEEACHFSGRYTTTPEANLRMLVRRKPVGPCFLITPWNFPLAMATRKIAPAIAAGCTSVIKPARLTPLTTMFFVKLLEDAGLPRGVVNLIPSRSAASVSDPLLVDPRLRKLSFTGSTEVGRSLLAAASKHVLRTSMELGGNAPFIVFDDADIDAAVEGAYAAKMRNGGEACTAANRFLVHRGVLVVFTEKLTAKVQATVVGDGREPGVGCGPMIEPAAVDKLQQLVDSSVEAGARVTCGGRRLDRPGYFFEPTVLADVPTSAPIFRTEIFGPVAPIYAFDTEAEAVALANDTEFGLGSYLYTSDLSRSLTLADSLDYGLCGVNCGVFSNAAAPFGGVKESGMGREGGTEGIAEYTEYQYVAIPM